MKERKVPSRVIRAYVREKIEGLAARQAERERIRKAGGPRKYREAQRPPSLFDQEESC